MKRLTAVLKNSKQLFALALIVVILACIIANMVNTSVYSVDVKRIYFTTAQGGLSGLLYLPKGAMYPGQSRNGILLFATIPSLTEATFYAKRLYKMTGNVITAAFFNTLLFTPITAANTIVYSFLK